MQSIIFTRSYLQSDLDDIIDLQQKNILIGITEKESKQEGFITVEHTPDLLAKMNQPHPHFIAKDQNRVVGYVLVMECKFKQDIPVLIDLFSIITNSVYKDKKIQEDQFFIMGQVCIDKACRGKGIFRSLYLEMRTQMSAYYNYIITEVSSKNTRSMNAHAAIGFDVLTTYPYRDDENWVVYILDIS